MHKLLIVLFVGANRANSVSAATPADFLANHNSILESLMPPTYAVGNASLLLTSFLSNLENRESVFADSISTDDLFLQDKEVYTITTRPQY